MRKNGNKTVEFPKRDYYEWWQIQEIFAITETQREQSKKTWQ